MRKITREDLSDEQEDILLGAPLKDIVLIQGPPGTGKTVMAFQRADALVRKNEAVNVIMFNKVLRRYSSNASEKKIETKTMNSWMWWWWKKMMNRTYPEIEKWHPDWKQMYDLLLNKQNDGDLDIEKLNWNHLIIDEAQDFSNKLFEFLNKVRTTFFLNDAPPALTILADENQMLTDENSTLEQIKSSLQIADEEKVFKLTENWRNTDEIIDLFNYFYTGTETGISKKSGRHGSIPKLVFSGAFPKTIKYICRYAKKYENQEIGVIVSNNQELKMYYDALEEELIDSIFNVQTYSWQSKIHKAEYLNFDKEGTVTVLNRASCKGLEFDAVFIPEIASMKIIDGDLDQFKMNMYVMSSRARGNLFYIVDDYRSPVMSHFPSKEEKSQNTGLNLLEYEDA